jgi:hypothetical protein
MSAPPVLTATGLRRSYGDRDVLAGLDLTVGRGEFVPGGLRSPTGSG